MNRVVVLGNGGAGKSTLATALGARTGLPVIHLDRLFWGPGWTPTTEAAWAALQLDLVAGARWIIDGNYSRTLPIRLARADTVLFLDLPRAVCLWAVTRRWLRYRGRTRPDVAPGVHEKLDPAFLKWIWDYPRRSRPRVLELMGGLPASTRVVRLTSRRAVDGFLAGVPAAPIR